MALSREFGLSRRQAYRYLELARAGRPAPPVAENSITITLKMPESLVGSSGSCEQARPHDKRSHQAGGGGIPGRKAPAWLSGNKYDVASNSSSHSIGCALPSLNRLTTFWFRIGSELSAA